MGDTAFRYGLSQQDFAGRLRGAKVGLVFTAPSTRTRASFWSAAVTLGCHTLHFGPADLQVTTGETWHDTGAVLANYLDAVVVRTNGPGHELVDLADSLPATVNALTHDEHPTQAIADLCALREHFGDTDKLRIAYLGEANNTARALALLVRRSPGMTLDVYSPPGFGFPAAEIAELNALDDGDPLCQHDELPDAPAPVDVVYTCRWQSMGVPHTDPDWLSRFRPFRVTRDVMRRFSGSTEAVFMHDLPATRDQEVTSDVLDGHGTTSLVARQAYHKESAAAAALLWALGDQ
jgi:ornithine carbamoyltransferase